MPISVLN
jgi:galactokinase